MGFSIITFIAGAILSYFLLIYGKYLDRQKRKKDLKNQLCSLIDQYIRKIAALKQFELLQLLYKRQFIISGNPKKDEMRYLYINKFNDMAIALNELKSEMVTKISQLEEFNLVDNLKTIKMVFKQFHSFEIASTNDVFESARDEELDAIYNFNYLWLSDRILLSDVGTSLLQIQKLISPNYFDYRNTVNKEKRLVII